MAVARIKPGPGEQELKADDLFITPCPPEEPWSSSQSGCLPSKRTWVRFQLRPNVISLLGYKEVGKNGSRHDKLNDLVYPCRFKKIIQFLAMPSSGKTSVSARYVSKKITPCPLGHQVYC